MKTLYIDCSMGASGDMLTAALLEIHPHPADFIERFNNIGIPDIQFTAEKTQKLGISGTKVKIHINGEEEVTEDVNIHTHNVQGHAHFQAEECSALHANTHRHYSYRDIVSIITNATIPEQVRNHALDVYKLLAQAESASHGVSLEEVHFHEVGAMDAIADVVAVCLLFHEIAADSILGSPINVGSGYVYCTHGILPVPAPATVYLLKDIPIYSAIVQSELCTPTGAALLRHFVLEYRELPLFRITRTGYGMGTKNFSNAPNCLRVFLGEQSEWQNSIGENSSDTIMELQCNLDDMTPEQLGFAMDMIQESDALDTFFTPIQMKKNRPAVLLSCLCKIKDKEKIKRCLFKHTTTLGIREILCHRSVLEREIKTEFTKFGKVRYKAAKGYGISRKKWEYEDIAKTAKENNLSLEDVKKQL